MSQPAENDLREPEGPWFVNVTHLRVAGRPLCCSPVDYERVMWSEDWSSVDCAACYRARAIPPADLPCLVCKGEESHHAACSVPVLGQAAFIAAEKALHEDGCGYPDEGDCTCPIPPERMRDEKD